MKKFIYVFVIAIFANSAFAQGIIDREFSSYLDQENVTHVYVSAKMFDIVSTVAAGLNDEDVKEITDFAQDIESFSLIKVPAPVDALGEFKKGLNSLSDSYEELVRVRDEGTRFAVFIAEENDIVYEIVGLGAVDGEFIALSLVGRMDLNKVADFVSKIDNEAFEPLKRMSDINPAEVKVYPNPATKNTALTIEIPEKMIGSDVSLYATNGQKIKTVKGASTSISLNTTDVVEGSYFVEIEKDGVTIKKQVIILQ